MIGMGWDEHRRTGKEMEKKLVKKTHQSCSITHSAHSGKSNINPKGFFPSTIVGTGDLAERCTVLFLWLRQPTSTMRSAAIDVGCGVWNGPYPRYLRKVCGRKRENYVLRKVLSVPC